MNLTKYGLEQNQLKQTYKSFDIIRWELMPNVINLVELQPCWTLVSAVQLAMKVEGRQRWLIITQLEE